MNKKKNKQTVKKISPSRFSKIKNILSQKGLMGGLFVILSSVGLVTAYNHSDIDLSKISLSNTPCLEQFYQGTAPYIHNVKSQKHNYALCYDGFSLMYSGVSKTPLWVAEYLTPERLAVHIKRNKEFHEEKSLPMEHRSLLSDYRRSGFDRGHMAPNGDMATEQSGQDSFTLTNIVPQHPKNNQGVWLGIEEATRAIVSKQKQPAYVVTGTLYENAQVQSIGQGVLVPTAVYKAVYYPQLQVASVYYTPNNDSQELQIMSVCELEQRTGINIFPLLPQAVKQQVYALPRSAKQVKANKGIEFNYQDHTSQCATPLTAQQIQWIQQQFVWNNFDVVDYSTVQDVPNPEKGQSTLSKFANRVLLEILQLVN